VKESVNSHNAVVGRRFGIVRGLWDRVPVVIRALVVAELILMVLGLPELLLLINLNHAPRIPWSLVPAGLWLWWCWQFLSGKGWPQAGATTRQLDLRARPLPGRVWGWALLAGGLGIVSLDALAFVTPRVAAIPREAFQLHVNLVGVPWWTLVGVLAGISAYAGILEEAAFRGYMLSLIERRHGWIVGVLLTGLAFFFDHHFSHAYATFAFLPFFLAISCLHGLLVYQTRSILPSVLLHTVGDFLVIPIQYGMIGHPAFGPVTWQTMDREFLLTVGVFVVFGVATVVAFRRLRLVTSKAGADDIPLSATAG
jgi:membrane protease YdiL (CAAX protease family)